MNHQQVAHRWAQDNGGRARGFNMYFEGASIFSYGAHFVIATWTNDAHGNRVVLFNADGYSTSTAKHKTFTRRAIRQGVPVYEVPDLSASADYTSASNGEPVIAAYFKRAAENVAKAARARVYGPSLLERAEQEITAAERFAQAFGHPFERPALTEVTEALKARVDAAAARYAVEREERAQREAARMVELRRTQAADFEQWQIGKAPISVPSAWREDENGNAYVRRYTNATRDELQTSQGASVPWEHAVKAFRFIALCVARGEAWERNGRVIRVGHYQLDRIAPNGDMTAGCHRFAWQAMRDLAEREGVAISGVIRGEEAQAIVADAVEIREGAHS